MESWVAQPPAPLEMIKEPKYLAALYTAGGLCAAAYDHLEYLSVGLLKQPWLLETDPQ